MVNIKISLSIFFVAFATLVSAQNNLRISSAQFSNLVNVNDNVLLNGYVVNDGILQISNQNFEIKIDIENDVPSDILLDNEFDELIYINNASLNYGDSIYFEKLINIDSIRFIPNEINVIVIWPPILDSTTVNEVAALRTTFVNGTYPFDSVYINVEDYNFLPQNIIDFLISTFPNLNIKEIDFNQTNIEIELNDGTEIKFTLSGNIIEIEYHNSNNSDDDDDYDDDEDDGFDSDDDDDGFDSDDDDDGFDSDDDDASSNPDDEDDSFDSDDDDGSNLDDGEIFYNYGNLSAIKINVISNTKLQIESIDKIEQLIIYTHFGKQIELINLNDNSVKLKMPLQKNKCYIAVAKFKSNYDESIFTKAIKIYNNF